jgi:hypothetical protein
VAERCSPVDLFRRFDETFMMEDYLEAYARFREEAKARPIGLVVPFDGYRGAMILHNGSFGTRSTKLTCPVPDDVPPHRVTVEAFQAFVRHLGRGPWTPKSPLPGSPQANDPEVSPDMPVTPSMVKALGAGPALIVLAWLRKILLSECGYDRIYVHRLGEDERFVKATQEQIASESGLSLRQVQRGLENLVEKGLVCPVGQTARSGLVLTPAALEGGDEC